MITISSDKLINKIVTSYNGQDQQTVEISHGQYILFADCRFIHNSYIERGISDDGTPTEITKLVNFYIYEASLYNGGEFIKDRDWQFDADFYKTEKEIYGQLKTKEL